MKSPRGTEVSRKGRDSQSLDRLCGPPMDVRRFLAIAIAVTEALEELHKDNIVHKNIQPSSIRVNPETSSVTLADVSEASRWPYPYLTATVRDTPAGSLAYMSPEQTGRMNRLIDCRSDLYSLGVTFYEMLTGRLPFQAQDPLEWAHCHIARMPKPPSEVLHTIPHTISVLVMKLLAKTAEERYQSAQGLRFDLEKCRTQWESREYIEPFALGKGDIPDRLLIPQRLYGREKDALTLLNAFDRVVQKGLCELVLVAGYAGIGKTSLVRELHRPVARGQGFLLSGKCDQYKRNFPYSTIAESFKEIIQYILTLTDKDIAGWAHRLQNALGANGQLIVEVIPQVELIVGKQPTVTELPPSETQHRFHTVFGKFVGAFTSRENPLVVFLDDLQWVDTASLKLIDYLVTNPDTRHLLLIGAFRDNEVDPSHPLMRMIDDVSKSRAAFKIVTLSPLSFHDLAHLHADTLHADLVRIEPLTRLVYEKTAGNPFFAIQFLTTLYAENLLRFDRETLTWQWDVSQIREKAYADNVVDLMAGKLRRLSSATQKALQLAACVGTTFDLQTLASIGRGTENETREALGAALQEGSLILLGDRVYAFVHDRVQQAAYMLIADSQRAGIHLEIGRFWLRQGSAEALEDRVFDIVNQFNMGVALVHDRAERCRVAELNLMAARKAKASTAYESSLGYLTVGAQLLDDRAWETHYDLAFDLFREFATVEYLKSNYSHSQQLIALLLTKARSDLEKAELYNILIVQYTLLAEYNEALQAGKQALNLLKVNLPETRLEEELARELERHKSLLRDRRASSLIDDPEMSDPEKRVALKLLSSMLVPARYTDSMLFALATVISVNLSIEYGPTPKSPVGYTAYGMFLGSQMNRYQEGYEFGVLALRISERFSDLGQKCQACFVLANYLNHWVNHLKHADFLNDQGYQAGLATGEMQWTGYIAAYKLFHPFYRGVDIPSIQRELPDLARFARETKNQWAIDTLQGLQLALMALSGSVDQGGPAGEGLDDNLPGMNEEDFLAACQRNKSSGAIGRYAILKAQTGFLLGRLEEALDAIYMAQELLGFISCSISVAEHNFFHSLILTALHARVPEEQKDRYVGVVRANQVQMHLWATHCKDNFEHQYLLVQAELARIAGQDMDAMRLYEAAVASAHANGFVQNEGIGYELAARFFTQRGFDKIASTYLREACACYHRWGADRKVAQLRDAHPDLDEQLRGFSSPGMETQAGQLDAIAMVKALQVISGEIDLPSLLDKLMRIVLENAGAQKGYLILADGEDLAIEAEAEVLGEETSVVHPRKSRLTAVLPVSVANYVKRTGESVILDDASRQQMFFSDPYIQTHQPLSVLCLPIVRHAKVIGLVYLENNLVKGAFTAERIAVLDLLASQAAISLEIATLYQGLRRAEEKYRGIFENIMEGVFRTSPDGRFIAANPALARMFGYQSPEELMQAVTNIEDQIYVDPHNRSKVLWMLETQGSVRLFEFQAYRKDGSRIWLTISARTVRDTDGTLLYYEGTVEDITERKHAEKERMRLVAAIEQAAEGMVITDPHGIIQYANAAFKQMSGYRGNEILGQHIRIQANSQHEESFYHHVRETREQGDAWSGRVTSTRKDGSVYDAEITGSPIRDQSGVIINYVSIHRDITHEVRLERELRQAQKMEAIGTLAGGIAHDFNNILMAIVGYTQLVHAQVPETDPIRRHLEQVLEASRRATTLVQQILTFSRRTEQERRPVPIAPIINEALKLLRSSLPSTIEIRQVVCGQPDGGTVLADPTQIHQVLMNLGTNAAHAMRHAGGLLTVELSDTVLDETSIAQYPGADPGPHVLLRVTDTGHGIDAAIIERIFDPYFTTKGPGEGTGLGLSVVQGIVKSLHGAISVSSDLEKGTTFRLLLPRVDSPRPEEQEPSQVLPTGSERVLFVDDEPTLADLGKEMLESLGYFVVTTTNSVDALECFREDPGAFDLVITDMTMPGLTGRELAEELMTIRPDIPVILCTGYSELMNGKQALEKGIREFVMKPYTIMGLANTIRKVLEQDRAD
jgi:PAS domain S-box-containing protein